MSTKGGRIFNKRRISFQQSTILVKCRSARVFPERLKMCKHVRSNCGRKINTSDLLLMACSNLQN